MAMPGCVARCAAIWQPEVIEIERVPVFAPFERGNSVREGFVP